MSSLVAKIEYVIIISNWTQKIMAGQKMKLRHSAESPWFSEKYIGWIMYGNRRHNTSTTYLHGVSSKIALTFFILDSFGAQWILIWLLKIFGICRWDWSKDLSDQIENQRRRTLLLILIKGTKLQDIWKRRQHQLANLVAQDVWDGTRVVGSSHVINRCLLFTIIRKISNEAKGSYDVHKFKCSN